MARLRLGSIDEEFHVRAVDLARLLKVTDNEISRLVRSAVLVRVRDPDDTRAFLYPCLANVTRFVEFRSGRRDAIHQKFLEEKAGREKATRLRIEMENKRASGELVDKRALIGELTPIIVAYREQLLSRADRLEREITRTKSRKEKVQRIRAADLDALGVLSGLFRGTENNGAKRS
jgi:hypothetical protein